MRSLVGRLVAFVLLVAAFVGVSFVLYVLDGRAAEIVQFSPQGSVKRVRQVTARFSEPMVPFGDLRVAGDGPFAVECPEIATPRWVDDRVLAYDFARDLPGGVRCRFTLKDDVRTLAGTPVAGPRRFEFDTGGPSIKASVPFVGHDRIDEGQVFVLTLDAEPTPASLRPNVWFVVEGLADRIGADVLDGQARADALELRPAGGEHVVVLRARQRFPNGARVRLVWAKGITSVTGIASGEDQTLDFRTRGPFTVEFHCERENRQAGCNPLADMWLEFSEGLPDGASGRIGLVGPSGKRYDAASEEDEYYGHRVAFPGPFPENAAFRVEVPAGLRDATGRPLVNAGRFPLAVKTAEFPPLVKFAARFGIIESKGDAALPVTVRNLEPQVRTRVLRADRQAPAGLGDKAKDLFGRLTGRVYRIEPGKVGEIQGLLRRLATASRRTSIFAGGPGGAVQTITLPRAQGPRAFEVVGIPLREPGFYLVEIESAKLGASLLGGPGSVFVPAGALVTNLSVHLKWGREDALAWVTALDTGRPVAGATVTAHDCRGDVLWRGPTDARGIARIGKVALPPSSRGCNYPHDTSASYADVDGGGPALSGLSEGLFVTAQSGADLTFVHSSWQQGIEPWRFRLPDAYDPDPVVAHTILDRMLVRAGETVHMTHVLRAKAAAGFVQAAAAERPATLTIRHQGSDEKHELALAWDTRGVAETSFTVPKEAKLGRYVLEMSGPKARERTSGHFQVEEFRVPLMKGTIKPPAAPQVAVKTVPLDLSVQYLAGGGASKLPVTVRSQVRQAVLPAYDLFEGFVFANGAVTTGPGRRSPARFWSEYDDEEGEWAPAETERAGETRVGRVHQTTEVTLDAAGTARTAVTDLPASTRPVELLSEMEFRDPNGEVQTVAQTVTLWPARWLVGLRTEGWLATKDRVAAEAAVVDVRGRPVKGVPLVVRLFQHKTYSHRTRLVGGFYGYEHSAETTAAGEFCRGTTDARGRLRCEGKTPVDGHLVLEARVADPKASAAPASDDVWVAGSEDWWFTVSEHDRMDLLPERRRYEPGETAKVQVRMPFREATALVALEREGRLLDAWVTTLSGKDPVVEVKVTDGHAPNVFVSVLAVRGRVGGITPTAMVDLGRPAFKLGNTELVVGWRPHELKVTVTPDRPVYQMRETATVKVRVRTAEGAAPPAGAEIALAAVDEGLLELKPNTSWQLLQAMMGRRWHGVDTATAQMQVIGKRHYGLKALPSGGGGGRQTTRELFDTLLVWKGRVPLDAKGEATVTVPLNDSLTGFRIVAVATSGVNRFGTGEARIRSTQDLMVLSGVAPLVREGDRVRSEFTLRNTTARPMDVTVTARVDGLAAALPPERLALAANTSAVAGWDLTVPAGTLALRYEVEAREAGGRTDRVRVEQQVRPATPIRTLQATLFQLDRTAGQTVARPVDAEPGRGDLRVVLSASLTSGLDGVREWWLAYPYACLEQKVSKSVALRDAGRWRDVKRAMPAYLDGNGLLKYFPTMEEGSVTLTAYVLALAHESGWPLDDEVQGRASAALVRFVDGTLVQRSPYPAATDLTWRKLQALEALSRYGRVEPRLVSVLTIDPNRWPTSAVLDWWNVLHRTPGLPNREARLREAEQAVRTRLNVQGTRMGFSTEREDHLWWLMVSPDANAVRLVLTLLETGAWTDDLPRLVRGALERQRRGAWDVTVTNVWGVLAVEKFSRAYETAPVTGATSATAAGRTASVDWAKAPKGDAVSLPWPTGQSDLALAHTGTGRPWVTVQSRAAIPLTAPLSSGYTITRSVTPIVERTPGRHSRGDVLRVRLDVEAESDMAWVVVSDPVPAGASHLGTGLARGSAILAQGEQSRGWAWPAFEERAFEAFRAYYAYVPKGRFSLEYTIRLNQSGRLRLPPTRVEAMYAPEMFAERPNESLEVLP